MEVFKTDNVSHGLCSPFSMCLLYTLLLLIMLGQNANISELIYLILNEFFFGFVYGLSVL